MRGDGFEKFTHPERITEERSLHLVASIATHIGKFWDSRMRAAIVAHLEAGGAGLDPAVRKALETLRPMSAQAASPGNSASV